MRLAVLSDIHGNRPALEAVLADLAAQGGADHLVIAGDLCADGPRPRTRPSPPFVRQESSAAVPHRSDLRQCRVITDEKASKSSASTGAPFPM